MTACANNATAKRKRKRRKGEGRETPCVSTFPQQRRLLQASGPHPAEGLCCTIAHSLNGRWLSSSCVCRELGEQQWPGSLAPAPRELTSASGRRSTSNTLRDVRNRQREEAQSQRGHEEPTGGDEAVPPPTETSRSGQARTWGRTLQAGETAKALGRQQVGRHGPPRPWG